MISRYGDRTEVFTKNKDWPSPEETAPLYLRSSWWVGSILQPNNRVIGLLGLQHLGGARHHVWLASTPELFRHPSSLVRTGRRWLYRLSNSLGLEVVAVAPPSYSKLPRLLRAWGFEYNSDFAGEPLYRYVNGIPE